MERMKYLIGLIGLFGIFSLTACSSGSGASTSDAGGGRGGTEFGFLTLSITDIPIDSATEVRVQIDGIELIPADNSVADEPVTILFNTPLSIDLLDPDSADSTVLFSNEVLPTGSYSWLKLIITAVNDGVLDSYITLTDGRVHELNATGDGDVSLQATDGVEIIANTPSAITIVFDLRKSVDMTDPADIKFNPNMNLVNDNETAIIAGTLPFDVLTSDSCSDADPASGNAVYLYAGYDVVPDDIDGRGAEPFMSATAVLNTLTGEFEYELNFVPFGTYTATFTCEVDLDAPVMGSDDLINFTSTTNVSVNTTSTTVLPGNVFQFSDHDDDDNGNGNRNGNANGNGNGNSNGNGNGNGNGNANGNGNRNGNGNGNRNGNRQVNDDDDGDDD